MKKKGFNFFEFSRIFAEFSSNRKYLPNITRKYFSNRKSNSTLETRFKSLTYDSKYMAKRNYVAVAGILNLRGLKFYSALENYCSSAEIRQAVGWKSSEVSRYLRIGERAGLIERERIPGLGGIIFHRDPRYILSDYGFEVLASARMIEKSIMIASEKARLNACMPKTTEEPSLVHSD
jgi:DNA-binding MarR family transcriptional regulator